MTAGQTALSAVGNVRQSAATCPAEVGCLVGAVMLLLPPPKPTATPSATRFGCHVGAFGAALNGRIGLAQLVRLGAARTGEALIGFLVPLPAVRVSGESPRSPAQVFGPRAANRG